MSARYEMISEAIIARNKVIGSSASMSAAASVYSLVSKDNQEPDPGALDCRWVACVGEDKAPAGAVQRARTWALGASLAEGGGGAEYEVGGANVIDASGNPAVRPASNYFDHTLGLQSAKDVNVPNMVYYDTVAGDVAVQLNHTHYKGVSQWASVPDAWGAARLGVPISVFHPSSSTIRVLWYHPDQGFQQTIVPLYPSAQGLYP